MVNKYAKWFRFVMWVGIIVNLLLSLPVILFPNTVLRLLGQTPSRDIVWTAFAGLLIFLLTLMYIPPARDPIGLRSSAKLAVFARFAEAFFFLILWPSRYLMFGLLDGLFFLILAPLLYLALKEHDQNISAS